MEDSGKSINNIVSKSSSKLLNPWMLHYQKLALELKCPLCLSWFKQPVLSPCNNLVCSSCMSDSSTISSEYALDLIEVAVVLPKQQQIMSNCYKIIHNVALEIDISPDTLTANINLQEGYMAPNVQHEIVNWLKSHVYTGAFHKGLKAKIKPANVSLDGSGASDGSDTSLLSDSGLPNPVAVNVESVPPRRRTISNISILKDNKVICLSEGFTTSEKGVHNGETFLTGGKNSSNNPKENQDEFKEESVGFILPFPDQTSNKADETGTPKSTPKSIPF
ncbi:hypothetical protein KIW84_042550 [Lathyrus oleraceus]|uniref:Uncharacterized protein n=1 Tax=Pisum sativum TaxID=3888 RepID=A0A9D4XES3_PEA|nr:hypothetical protein KIW84_042550 [Pisum sativum]